MVPAVCALRWSLVSTRLGWWIGVPMLARPLRELNFERSSQEYEGKPIASVQFDPERQPLTFDQLMAMLPLHAVGAAAARLGSARFHSTLCSNRRVCRHRRGRTLARPSGVILKFITKPAYFIGYFDVAAFLSLPMKDSCWWPPNLLWGPLCRPPTPPAAVAASSIC
jgi:hypothetical protein